MENEGCQTVLDVIERHLEAMNAKSFVLRVAYAGEHDVESPENNLGKFYQDLVKRINSGYCDVSLAGFVLIYKCHFIVVIEGSEDTIMRHIDCVLNSNEKIGKTKLLAVYHNVERRFFSSWRSFFAEPLPLELKIDDLSCKQEMQKLASKCMEKLHFLIAMIIKNPETIVIGDITSDIKSQVFPEISLINPILLSPCIMDLRKYLNMYMTLPEYSYSFENCWPAPFDFTPTLENKSQSTTVYFPPLNEIIEKCKKNRVKENSESDQKIGDEK